MIRTKRSDRVKMIKDINITPFTDVCLVLLIIFMVTASALTNEASLRINLPKAATAPDTQLPANITVRITRERELYVNSQLVTGDTLATTLRTLHLQSGARLLVVRADEGIPYRDVVTVIDTARHVGLDQIALATRQPEHTPVTPGLPQ
jgi:biopolymer transport protein ExbD